MKFQCCFIANCHHSSPPSALAQQNIVSTNENSESFCCAPSYRNNEEDVYSSDIECSDKESTSSSEMYTTADEGYDVCFKIFRKHKI